MRTDLALEWVESNENKNFGIEKKIRKNGNVTVNIVDILSNEAATYLGKEKGKYITVHFPEIFKIESFDLIEKEIEKQLLSLMPKKRKCVLVAGLGNRDITCDSIGPLCAEKILATRHIINQNFIENIKETAVIIPDVSGKTGIEAADVIKSIADKIKPSMVIVIDALAAGSINRIYRTVQLSNTGISPGSGVKNSRKEISEKTLGIPVISIGVPTVVETKTIAEEMTGKRVKTSDFLIVTPRESDIYTKEICEVLSRCINRVLQPDLKDKELSILV